MAETFIEVIIVVPGDTGAPNSTFQSIVESCFDFSPCHLLLRTHSRILADKGWSWRVRDVAAQVVWDLDSELRKKGLYHWRLNPRSPFYAADAERARRAHGRR